MKAATKQPAAKKPAKSAKRLAAASGQFMIRRDDNYELDRVKDVVAQMKKDPKKGHAMLVQAGIYTQAGKLTKAFGG